MTRYRRPIYILLMLCCLLTAALVVGCGGKGAPGGTGVVKLTLFTWTPPDELKANQDLIKEFEQQRSDITVEIINDPTPRSMDKLQTMMAAGNTPDVMSIHGAYFLPFAAKGALANLEPMIKADQSFDLPDFYPQILPICRYRGDLYSLPRYASVYVLFYNKSLFDEAGLRYPDGSWTWDTYLAAARKLTRPSKDPGKQRYGCIIDFWGARIYPWIWQNGGQVLDDAHQRCLLDQPPAAEALQFLVDLMAKYKVAPRISQSDSRETKEWFKAGRVGMFNSGAWDVQLLRRTPQLRWDIAPLPKQKQRATLAGTENYAISSTSRHPKEAWELFKFLLAPHAQEIMADRVDKQPSRQSVATGPYLRAKVGYDRRVLVDALSYGKLAPNVTKWDSIAHLIQDRLDLIWGGELSVRDGTRQAAADMTAALQAPDQ